MADACKPEIDPDNDQEHWKGKKISVHQFLWNAGAFPRYPGYEREQQAQNQESHPSLAPSRAGIQAELFGEDRGPRDQYARD